MASYILYNSLHKWWVLITLQEINKEAMLWTLSSRFRYHSRCNRCFKWDLKAAWVLDLQTKLEEVATLTIILHRLTWVLTRMAWCSKVTITAQFLVTARIQGPFQKVCRLLQFHKIWWLLIILDSLYLSLQSKTCTNLPSKIMTVPHLCKN